MKLYLDKDLTQEVEDTISFGIVDAGDSKQITLWLQNDMDAQAKEILVTVDHEEVKVIEAPTELMAHESAEVIIEWQASVSLKEGLRDVPINVFRKEIYG